VSVAEKGMSRSKISATVVVMTYLIFQCSVVAFVANWHAAAPRPHAITLDSVVTNSRHKTRPRHELTATFQERNDEPSFSLT